MDNKSKVKWDAKWITKYSLLYEYNQESPAPFFRKSFNLKKDVKKAKLYICGIGYNEVYVNGKKVGDEVLSPAFTNYDKTCLYNTYDISNYLKKGDNVIGVILGNGMYNVQAENSWELQCAPWRHHPKMILKAEIEFEDSTNMCIKSDEKWKVSYGPIKYNSVHEGEIFDARDYDKNWAEAEYDDSKWERAHISKSPGGKLKPMEMEPCRVIETIKPIKTWKLDDGAWIVDIGKNISGWVKVTGENERGKEIKMIFAEKLNESKDIDQSNLNTLVKSDKFQTDTYIFAGDGKESYEPRFTYHGFQYVKIIGLEEMKDDTIVGRRVHTDLDTKGSFKCSNDLLNKIQDATILATLSNYVGMPTDCPHREKNGWTGDAAISADQVMYNFDPTRAYLKWLGDFRDMQRENGQLPGIVPSGGWGYNWGSGPAWDIAYLLLPWYMYLYCENTKGLEENYDNMKKYVDFMCTMAIDYRVDFGLGDWCPPRGGCAEYKCPTEVTDTAYFHMAADILSKAAWVLGKEKDSKKYAKLKENIFDSFNNEYVNEENGFVKGDCQTSYSCVLYFGLTKKETKKKIIDNLIKEIEKYDRHIDCGILGTKYVMNVLMDIGRNDLAYEIATKKDFPSWGYWIEQGATTLWENWNGENSRNHHMFSDISAWFYKSLAGINVDPKNPGFKHIIIKPQPAGDLKWVEAKKETTYGEISVDWKIENDVFTINAKIPEGTKGSLYIPIEYKEKAKTYLQGNIKIV